MNTQATDTSVSTSTVVDVPVERAFEVFTADISSWWNPDHHILEAELEEIVFEPRVGGHIYDRGVDGSECRWARVLAYEPPNRLVFSWDIGLDWKLQQDPTRRARSRCGSSPRARAGPAWSSSTATSTATARAGSRCATPSARRPAGRTACAASPSTRSAEPMPYFAYKLIPPRPSFHADMSDSEMEIMGAHAGYWSEVTSRGDALIFGPVLDPAGTWGLAVVEADSEDDVRALGQSDPAITSELATFEVFAMPGAVSGRDGRAQPRPGD
jgi:uncharacterized protein YndB with AHSA1/START domain/uncharacterized protein YciI